MTCFQVKGFNPCESLLRHTTEQISRFICRMKELGFSTLIVHSDYGWRRHQELLSQECRKAGVEITLMVFGPRTFFSLLDWKRAWFAMDEQGRPFTEKPECETHPCASNPEAVSAFQEGAERWFRSVPSWIKRVHMRAGDGLMFCRCKQCRLIPEHEQYRPFVEAFIRAAKKVRPDIKLETDLYVKRYHVPLQHEAYGELDRLMFDTFYRHPFFPIGSKRDTCNRACMRYAAPEGMADADTPNEYYLKRLKEWNQLFPGKVYIHENVMCQGFWGISQHNASVYLTDRETYRQLGLLGVCHEAYEPGYGAFADIFSSLAAGRRLIPETELERLLPESGMKYFCTSPTFPLEKYLDKIQCRLVRFHLHAQEGLTAQEFRQLVEFEWNHENLLDPVLVGYSAARGGMARGTLCFKGLSEQASDFLARRKLWDFMEEIPLGDDPRDICKKLIFELAAKAYDC